MRFYAVRTDAIELTHQALQKLDQKFNDEMMAEGVVDG
jgi:hypothetical protein